MDERRRFQIALGGVASLVLIAGLFVASAPPVTYPAVSAPQPFYRIVSTGLARPAVLPESWAIQEPAERPRLERRRPVRPSLQGRRIVDLVASNAAIPPVAEVQADGAMPLPSRAPRLVPTSAPAAHAQSVAASVGHRASATHDVEDRGPVTGAFAAAGKEVGRGFRTAGRAIKSIF